MENINVRLRMSTANPFYEDLYKYPPKNVKYSFSRKGSTKDDSKLVRKLKKEIWIKLTEFIPPQINVDQRNSDLIYSLNGTMIKNKHPWIVDAEHVASFCNFHTNSLHRKFYKKQIVNLLDSKFCKKIMPWTYASKKTMEDFFNKNSIEEKLEVVYPAIKSPKIKKKSNDDVIKILFVGRLFFEKGGLQLLKSFEILKKKYDLNLVIISNTPELIQQKYRKFRNIEFYQANFTRKELFNKYFSKSDIFVMPSFIDTFGGVFLESMTCELPIVTTDIFSLPEVVKDKKSGLIVHTSFSMFNNDFSIKWGPKTRKWKKFVSLTPSINEEFIDGLVEKISILIDSKNMRNKFGKYGKREVEMGRFSIKERNKKLKKIYEESVE
jgi:glycosyltransferase involved in cell wall biosynthesis